MKLAILGAGSFGTSLAMTLSEKFKQVFLWSHSPDVVNHILNTRENSVYLPGFFMPPNVQPSGDMEEVMKDADVILSVVPTQATREVWEQARNYLNDHCYLVFASKGIEQKSHKLVNEIAREVTQLGDEEKKRFLFLSGPSFAKELAEKKPTAITIAGYDSDSTKKVQELFHTSYFRTYGTTDVVGVELGGALKNIMAIATGVSDGLGMGNNARAALITRGLAEIARLGRALGADPLTFMGLAGMGDLVLTCTGDLSRNRLVGIRLAKGEKIAEIVNSMRMVAEGVTTTESAYHLAREKGVEMPITEAAYHVLYLDKSPRETYGMLMNRQLKFETEL